MNAESAGQDPEISQVAFVRTAVSRNENEQEQSEDYNRKYTQSDQYSLEGDVCDIDVRNPPTTPNVAGRNKRKNFNPRYTSGSSMGEENDESPVTVRHNPELRGNHHHFGLASRTSESPTDCPAASVGDVGVGPAPQRTDLPPWMQMLNQYDQFVKTAGLAQYPMPSVSDGGGYSMQESPASVMPEWARKFGTSELAVSAIHDLLKVYHKRGVNSTSSLQTGYGSGNLPTETEPPTPPTTPHAYHSASRSIIPNGGGDHLETTVHQSPAKKASIDQSPPPILASAMAGSLHTNNYPTNLSNYKRDSPLNESPPRNDHHWANQSAPAKAHNTHQTWQTKESSGDEGHSSAKTPADGVNSLNDDSSDYCDPALNTSGGSSSHQLRQWPEDFQNIPGSSFDKRIKSECDDTDTTIGDADNNPYDEDDYPASPTDYPDSTNDDDDDDGNFSVNTFCDDEISTGDDQMRTTSECDRNNTESVDVDEAHSAVAAEKEGSCSNSSSKISVRNLGALFDQSQLNLVPSKMRGGIDEKGLHAADFVQNMSKFTSYLECQNEMCRLENLREHYHCYDFPCFGKVFSKKEEVIRHVKWHRKRMESLNHGFMRFSSSDDCSTTFGSNCPHNRKQTHYHCFQPNCDRVYISTSDVQMHSNFHRKDSAIHKEGFQRFRANEKCSADYCMFSGQKTTHFHCRRDNCKFTFKNKADMEKHKTYHIKDLKLARDGFKKFLKNEQCPYKQCRFSRVCNHIHCARENCFYVLHSSGQLLSHKRKHERMDNEQTYCRYKMLAVKAALLGNAAAAAAAVTPKISPYNLTSSLLRLRDMDIGSVGLPRAASEPSLPSPQQGMYNKDSVNEPPSPTSLSTEFLQQMKKRHDELLKQQKLHLSTRQVATDVGRPEVSMFPVTHPEPTSPQHQYNMGLDHKQLTPSVIQQFFTTECVTQSADNDDPINLTNISSTGGKAEAKPQCPWKERLEAHLHCIFKDCEAVIPNNVLDMTAHIRMHGYNRDVYATTAAASEPLLSSGSTTSNNAMQITTIDGFFNRKRGRPPKNRFVEVYKNAQQSPQAIFTSFKLEKQAVTNSTTCDNATSIPHNQPPTGSLCNDTQRSLESPLSLVQPANLVQTSMTSQFTTHKANEHCGVGGLRCSLSLQHHYHCICSADCTFITAERDLLAVHLERLHTAASFADTISHKFKRFDRHIGLDCGILECRLRKTRPHLHCRQCYRQISPFDLETHICGNIEYRPISLSPTKRRSEQQLQQPAEISGDNFTIHSAKHLVRDFSSLPSVTFSTINELRRKVSEMEPEASSTPKRSHEDEKVLVVRAAGTYFPENTNELSGISPNAQQKLPSSASATECIQLSRTPSTAAYCSTPYCKMKRKPHEHCEFCDQSFVDLNKSRAHRLTHIVTPTKPIPSHQMSLHSSDFGEDNKRKSYPQQKSPMEPQPALAPHMYEEQPQDLTLSPNAPAISMTHDDRTPPNRETYTTPPAAAQSTSAPAQFPNIFPPDFMCSLSMQNFHLAQLAALYQQNPYYYQHLYPFLSNAAAFSRQQQNRQVAGNDDKGYFPAPADCPNPAAPPAISPLLTAVPSAASGHFTFLNPLLLTRTAETATASQQTAAAHGISPNSPMTSAAVAQSLKRKQSNGSGERFSAIIDALAPSTKKRMQFAAGLAAAAAAAATTANVAAITSGSHQEQHGQHFKIKDEQIPTGYLKFRFNEDCYFPKCGYRNHQSHFHCDRNDCHYSFCDKTRFVQHTARHERLDKLMGNDFRQYRANMNCGYENCPYFKNLGSANKSSHFHCLKCDFICSDTNKVVAHRRQHSKMEYIRMAGFRKVTNSERCNSTFEATVPTNGNDVPGTVECSYSQKQTHYHCLVCDVSVLSRAQLASHKHKTS